MNFEEQKYIGVPYKLYGTDTKGIDCTNLVIKVAKDRGINMPNINHFNYTEQTSYIGITKTRNNPKLFIKLEKPTKDSIVVLSVNGIAGHVGYMLDEVYFIHIMPKRNVKIERIDSLLWRNSIVGYYKYIGKEKEINA